MYTLVRGIQSRQLLWTEAASFFASLVIAERCYHFRSFTLECVAFLATWFVISGGLNYLTSERRRDRTA